jgi:hypothetical protein
LAGRAASPAASVRQRDDERGDAHAGKPAQRELAEQARMHLVGGACIEHEAGGEQKCSPVPSAYPITPASGGLTAKVVSAR